MENAKHWDYAEVFSGRDAAYLIAGFDPAVRGPETEYKIQPIIARMKKSYYRSVKKIVDDTDGAGFCVGVDEKIHADINPFKQRTPENDDFWSVEIEELIKRYNEQYDAAGFPGNFEFVRSDQTRLTFDEIKQRVSERIDSYFTDEHRRLTDMEREVASTLWSWAYEDVHEFDDQSFSRGELHRWISNNNFGSEYNFATMKVAPAIVEKPLLTTERNTLLTLIAALCDYSDIKHQSRGVAAQISKMTSEIGAEVSDDTIRDVLAKIPDALLARTK
jgi:hypothetical protein